MKKNDAVNFYSPCICNGGEVYKQQRSFFSFFIAPVLKLTSCKQHHEQVTEYLQILNKIINWFWFQVVFTFMGIFHREH